MSARGAQRERAVRDWLAGRGWLAFRAPASLGCADVAALRADTRPRLGEVKSIAGAPYERHAGLSRTARSTSERVRSTLEGLHNTPVVDDNGLGWCQRASRWRRCSAATLRGGH